MHAKNLLRIHGSAVRRLPVLPVPKGWDYDLWLGPAPEAPFCQDRVRGGIFQIRDYSLGMIANWGAHPIDQVQWWADHVGMGIPVTYEGTGAIATGGLYNCMTNWHVRCTYENGLVIDFTDNVTFRTVNDAPKVPLDTDTPFLGDVALFVGTDGWVANTYQKVVTQPASLVASEIGPNEIHLPKFLTHDELVPPGLDVYGFPAACHQLGWIEYLKAERQSKTPKDTVDPIESAVRTDLISQLSDICVRTGRKIRWDPRNETIVGDEEAKKMMSVPMREPWGTLVRTLSL